MPGLPSGVIVDTAAGTNSVGGHYSSRHSTDAGEFFHSWLAAQCSMIAGTAQGVLVMGAPDEGPFVPVALWPAGQAAGPLLAEVSGQTLAAREARIVKAMPSSIVTCPVLVDGQLYGLVAVETTLDRKSVV